MMDEDLIDLLSAWRGGEIDPVRCEQLLARLGVDEAFQQSFVDEIRMLGMLKAVQSTEPRWLSLHEELGWASGTVKADEDHEDEVMRRVYGILPRRSSGPWGWVSVAAAAAIFLIGLAALEWPRGHRSAPVTVEQTPSVGPKNELAVVIKLDAVRWDPSDQQVPSEGATLSSGRFRIGSGQATLFFFNGVTLVLEGPADLDLVSIDRVFCRRGKLRARVPEGAEGFVVTGPGSAVVDLGTEFGLNVEDGGRSRVMVFEGAAEAALLDSAGCLSRTQIVGQSKEFELDPSSGRIAQAVARPEGFVAAPDLAVPPLHLESGYAGAILQSRPRSYWRFESLARGAVPNEVPGGPPLRVNGPVKIPGGSKENGCALFKPGASHQFLTTDGLWELDREPGHAVELWFMPETFSYSSLVGLFPPAENFPPGHVSRYVHALLIEATTYERQTLNKRASVRFLRRWPLEVDVGTNLFSQNVYVPLRWHHVVAQKDGNRMELYIDGVRNHSMTLEADHPNLFCRLVVGRRTTDGRDPKDCRSFVGRLDELAIYDHPLSPEEVRHHYQLGSTPLPAPR
jgi:hypothetical protein